MRRRSIGILTVTLVLALSTLALGSRDRSGPAGGDPAENPADRLLEAELLEISAGALRQAMEIYESIRGDERAPEMIRARALLYLARCHRKLGDLERAKRLLGELVKSATRDREILRQARSFLRELTGGKAENPEFDWLGELERDPEIQRRVFDLAMDLANPEGDEYLRGRRQLLALGRIALPVLERLIETSRDGRHRQQLAIILLHSGRFERLPVVLDPKHPPDEHAFVKESFAAFLELIPSLGGDEIRRLLEVLGGIPPHPAIEPLRDLVHLWAGDRDGLADRLVRIEELPSDNFRRARRVREHLLGREPEIRQLAVQTMARRILETTCPVSIRGEYYRLLEDRAPEALRPAHAEAMVRTLAAGKELGSTVRRPEIQYYLEDLRDMDAGDILAGLIPSDLFDALRHRSLLRELARQFPQVAAAMAGRILDSDCDLDTRQDYFLLLEEIAPGRIQTAHILSLLESSGPAEAGVWIRELEERGEFETIAGLATGKFRGAIEHHPEGADRAPVGWVRVYRALENWSGVQYMAERDDAAIQDLVEFLNSWDPDPAAREGYRRPEENWRPSAALREAMIPLLEAEKPLVRAVALEILARDPASLGDEVLDTLEGLAAGDTDLHVREIALLALLESLGEHPERAASTARILAAEQASRQAMEAIPEDYEGSPLAAGRLSALGRVRFSAAPDSMQNSLLWILSEETARRLYPAVLDLAESGSGVAFHEWFVGQFRKHPAVAAELRDRLAALRNRELLASICQTLIWHHPGLVTGTSAGPGRESPEEVLAFLKRVVNDRSLSLETRLAAWLFPSAGDWEWIDWPALLTGDDPLAARILDPEFRLELPRLRKRSNSQARKFWEWLEGLEETRRSAIHELALASPVDHVRELAVNAYPPGRAGAAGVFRSALEDSSPAVRRRAVKRLATVLRADVGPSFIPLLEDEDRMVRLEAVKALMRFAPPESIEPLVKLLDDADIEIRESALAALQAIRQTLEEKGEWQDLVRAMKEEKSAPSAPPETEKKPEKSGEVPPGESPGGGATGDTEKNEKTETGETGENEPPGKDPS